MRISFDLSPDASYKSNRFSETLLEKSLKFVPSKRDGIVAFNLGFMLLPAKVDSIAKEQSCKRNALAIRGTGCMKIIFALLTKVLTFHVKATIIQVGILGFDSPILSCKACFATFLALKKQF